MKCTGYVALLWLASTAAECERDGRTYSEGDHIGMPLRASCSNEYTTVNVYEYCTSTGDWETGDDSGIECFDGEKCEIEEGTATCVPISCQRDGTTYGIYDQIRVPDHDSCLNDKTFVMAYDECAEDGGFENQDKVIHCGLGERCDDQNGCVAVQCEANGVFYDEGSRIRASQHDSCQDIYHLVTGYQFCNDQGEWVAHTEVEECFDGEKCELHGGISTCALITCKRAGSVIEVYEQIRAPTRDRCIDEYTFVKGFDECSDDGGFENLDEVIYCGRSERCGGGGCVPISCQSQGAVLNLYDRVRSPERDGCRGHDTVIVAYDECADHETLEHQDSIIACPVGLECVDTGDVVGCLPPQ